MICSASIITWRTAILVLTKMAICFQLDMIRQEIRVYPWTLPKRHTHTETYFHSFSDEQIVLYLIVLITKHKQRACWMCNVNHMLTKTFSINFWLWWDMLFVYPTYLIRIFLDIWIRFKHISFPIKESCWCIDMH